MAAVIIPLETGKPHFLKKEAAKLVLRAGDEYQLNTSAFHDADEIEVLEVRSSGEMMSDELNSDHCK